MMRVLCVTSFAVSPGDRWLWNELPERADDVQFVQALPPSRRWLSYILALLRQEPFDLIVAWENKTGLPLAVCRWLVKQTWPPLVWLTLTAKPYLNALRPLLRRCLVDRVRVTLPSCWEAQRCQSIFQLSPSRVSVCRLGGYDIPVYLAERGILPRQGARDRAVFAGGQTDRDYATLLAALAKLPQPLSQPALISTPSAPLRHYSVPAHVAVRPLLPRNDYFAALMRSRVVAISLQPVTYAAGLTLLLDAMSAGCAIVCTDLPVLREYVVPGVTGLLLPSGDVAAWREGLAMLLDDAEKCYWMGQQARALWEAEFAFPLFARRAHAIMRQTLPTSPSA